MQACLIYDTIEAVDCNDLLIYFEDVDSMELQKTVIKIDPDVGRLLKMTSAARGLTMKDVVTDLVLQWVAENTPPTGIVDRRPGTDTATGPLPPE